MPAESKRRVDSNIEHNLFWITDISGKYGLYIKSASEFASTELDIKLRGIALVKRNFENAGELFLILKKNEDWELFLVLCRDIISTCSVSLVNEKMINAVENRLRRWQVFLMQNNDISISYEKQMGLFAELQFLKNILIPAYGSLASLTAWNGPEADKQDFSLPKIAVEVKSFRSSNGLVVTISSAHQLLSNNKPIYLIAYGLTEDLNGSSIQDVIEELTTDFESESMQALQQFEKSIIDFGYMPGVNYDHMYKFRVDGYTAYLVEDDFPRIVPMNIATEIVAVNYSIDLAHCNRFQTDIHQIVN